MALPLTKLSYDYSLLIAAEERYSVGLDTLLIAALGMNLRYRPSTTQVRLVINWFWFIGHQQ
jgi:hypothetical protein